MQPQNMPRHNSCLNTLAIIDYVSRHYGKPEDLLEGLERELHGLPDPLEFLKDPNNWVSAEVCRKMYANARRISGDEEVAFRIGFESLTHKKFGYISGILLKVWTNPVQALRNVKRVNDKFNRNKKIEMIRLPGNKAIIKLYWAKNLELNRDFCLMNKGVYTAVPTIWGLPAGQIIETQCQFDGGECCEFHASWEGLTFSQRLKNLFPAKGRIVQETLSEMERDKRLLEEKYQEVESLNKRLQQRIDQLLSIQQASETILSELDFSTISGTILNLFVKEIGYSKGMLMLIDQDAQLLKLVDSVGASEEAKKIVGEYTVPLSRSEENILAEVAVTGQPLIAEDTSSAIRNPDNIIFRQVKPQSIILLPLKAQGKVIGVLAAEKSSDGSTWLNLDQEYLQGFANQMALAIENARMYTELRGAFLSTIQALATALEAKDTYTRGHSERVARYSVRLAERLGMNKTQVEQIRSMCLVHDIGKIGIGEGILNKKGRLEDEEFAHIREHPDIGQRIIKPLNLSDDEMAIIEHHHERLDGRGYPSGLTDNNIPIQVRITTICDAFDAMTSDRPYRQSRPLADAVKELMREAGAQFDPDLVNIFIDLINEGGVQDIMDDRVFSDEPLEDSAFSDEQEPAKPHLYEVKKEETPIKRPTGTHR
ncbi:MAG: HD domain-containing protein [Deltaproteobacteria bacterium]|nr:HD domain-containing protein [Deltaproteobacteria bacterium]